MIKVLKAGFYSTIQDLGRFGFQQFGVPYSGVMDRKAAVFANILVGNPENEAVIEMTMTGATLQFKVNTRIALSGASMFAKLNEKKIDNNVVISVYIDDVLSFGKLESGFRCYLAVLGGFNTETVMKSKSMYQNITKASVLFKNDELDVEVLSKMNNQKHAKIRCNVSYLNSNILEVYKGPEFEYLSEAQQNQLFSSLFTVSEKNNRMGYQLIETLENNLNSIITGPVIPGTIQLTPSGKLIILMRDCQTTGGYPRIFQLSDMSINILAQKYTGQKISFKLKE